MTWKPIHPSHAIERVRLVFEFAQPLPTRTVNFLGDEVDQIRSGAGFTDRVARQGAEFSFGPNGISGGSNVSGWELQKKAKGTNQILEVLLLDDSRMAFESIVYVRWADFKERFDRIAKGTLSSILGFVDLKSYGLEYVDRFVYLGDIAAAVPGQLIPKINDYIEGPALDGKEPWHVHRGWFEEFRDLRILVNQNVDTQDGSVLGKQQMRSVQILTKIERREVPGELDYSEIQAQIDVMHVRSKEVFGSLISEEMRREVGVFGGDL